jgi:uncharacterized protein (DUF1800 family)
VARATQQGLAATVDAAFAQIRPLPVPASLAYYMAEKPANLLQNAAAHQAKDQAMMDQMGFFFQDYRREVYHECIERWLEFAVETENSAQENLFMFLSNVLVVGINKIDNPDWVFPYFAELRNALFQPYPAIIQRLPHTPAMCSYLDLVYNARGGPNENYARELMELFTLGIGHYSEGDVKEMARALTGFSIENDRVKLDPTRWDAGNKTIFGQTGPWTSDDIVRLIFSQPGARTHLPRRLLAWYVSDAAIPEPYIESLGALWAQQGWRIVDLVKTVLSSQLFYASAFRGNLVKNPVKFYLGLCQTLGVDVMPFPGQIQALLAFAGQEPLDPPTVRGFLGGHMWLNSTTWLARNGLVTEIFNDFHLGYLTPENQAWLKKAQARGRGNYYIAENRFDDLAAMPAVTVADHLLQWFLPGASYPAYRTAIADYLENTQGTRIELIKDSAIALLLSPPYQVC